MIEPTILSIASGVTAILVPFLTKGAQEFVRVAGEAAYEKTKSLLQELKAKWVGDKQASETLARFEEKPEAHQAEMEQTLAKKMTEDKALEQDMDRRLKDLGPVVVVFQKMKDAEDVTGAEVDDMTAGRLGVNQDIDKAKKVTGVKIKRMGG